MSTDDARLPWSVLDATCVVGRHVKWQGGQPQSVADLLAEMDHYGVAEALVLDCLSRENHPAEGNPRIVELLRAEPRLHPAWSAVPAGTDEQPPPAALVAAMRAAGVGALFLLPGQFKHPLSDWCVDDLLDPLAAAGAPLFVSFVEVGPGGWPTDVCDWPALVELCRRWPTLPVVLWEFRIRRGQRALYKALDACPNLRVELSGYWLHHGVEYLSQRWGPERLIYGSNWPTFGPHMTLSTLASADLSDDAKRLIAGDNLRQLLRWCDLTHPAYTPPAPADAYVASARRGLAALPLPTPVADCHGHLGGYLSHYHVPDGRHDDAVADMDRLGVECCCVFSFSGVTSDETAGNDRVAEAVAAHPDRFVGFTLVNPHRGRAAMLAELERGVALGLRGVKLIPSYQGYPEEGPNIDVACEWADAHGQLILNHHWGGAAQVERLVATYPNACFLTGHTTTAYAAVMRQYANLYVCSCPLLGPRACEEVVAAIGADRFLFGSDLLDLPIAWGLGPILFARIPPEQKRLILGDNLRRLLASYSRGPAG
ncbi:MAG: amidohydrolase family protein [Fimbriimonadaceae bacterium]|nr:amidohydrolase family protein [Fimbriimonadaceae bacterium]